MAIIGSYIDGQMVVDDAACFGNIYNPATGAIINQLAYAKNCTVEAAIASAKRAFPVWTNTPPLLRARVLAKFKVLIEENAEKIASLLTEEHGKTLDDSRGEVVRGLEVVEFACGAPHLLKGYFSECVGRDIDSYTMCQSLGVCVGITPFNFPAMVPLWMFPIAIAAGNTFVLKPSEKDPSCSILLAELLIQAGAPSGVLNVVQGGKEVVDQLLVHKDIAAVSFVGSTPIAHYIYQTATKNGKRCQALGGAKNHGVVMPDADLEVASSSIIGAAFGSAGERCMALPIVVAVGDQTADNLIEILATKTRAVRVGAGDQPNVDMGPLVTSEHLTNVLNYIDVGIKEGAQLVVDGRDLKPQGYEQGYFLAPCLFDHVVTSMRIYKEEIFGPVLGVVRVPDLKTALQIINDHEFGNGTVIFTRDGSIAREFVRQVQVGMVGVNVPLPVPVATHSFGGWKRSLFGDLHVYGPDGIKFYTKQKNVMVRWPSVPSGSEFLFPTVS